MVNCSCVRYISRELSTTNSREAGHDPSVQGCLGQFGWIKRWRLLTHLLCSKINTELAEPMNCRVLNCMETLEKKKESHSIFRFS